MNNYGFKIINDINNQIEVIKILEFAKIHKSPVEFAVYRYDEKNLEFSRYILKEYNDLITTIHLNSANCLVLHPNKDFSRTLKENIIKEIQNGTKYGIKRYVLHLNSYKLNVASLEQVNIDLVISRLKELSIILEEYDVEIFIENLYEPLTFYKKLFKTIFENKLNRIHHTFDFGHAKVWGEHDIEEYFEYLKVLKYDYNMKFHFHVHTNNGLYDEHKSFLEGINTNRNDIDGYYLKNKKIEDYVIEFIKEFSNDTFVMEMITEEQINNYIYLNSIFKNN